MNCNLCNSKIENIKTDIKGKKYLLCSNCDLIQLEKQLHLTMVAEKQRYKLHENSSDNIGYLNYLNNIITNSITPFLKHGDRLFYFFCGPEKTWKKLLKDKGYYVTTYDPFFDNNSDWLNKNFNAVTAIEVFEHLSNPAKELDLLSSLLSTGSLLVIRTMLHNNNWDIFQNWWYKEDPTHLSFYSETTINYICRTWKYKILQIKDQCEIVLKKK